MSGTIDQRAVRSVALQGETRRLPTVRLRERFDFVRRLGAGAMGEVWEALDRAEGGRRVAIKMLHEHRASDEVTIARLLREARALAALQHPHVVKVVDVFAREDGIPCLVQEYLDGEPLRARMARVGAISVPEAIGMAVHLLDALGAVHAAGILHRDVKPENILLRAIGGGLVEPHLIDFGIARMNTPDERTLTSRSTSPGTPGYMSPEQVARGRSEDLDARTDVWSAALVLWEMLAGRHPFVGGSAITSLARPALEDVPRIDRVVPGTPRSLGDVLARALARDRAARTASASALLAALLDGHAWSSEPWCIALRTRYVVSSG